jgi:rhodanese-related sulfurtransferase
MRKTLLHNIYIFSAAAVIALFLGLFTPGGAVLFGQELSAETRTLTFSQAQTAFVNADYVWSDSRGEYYYERYHIKGAINVPLNTARRFKEEKLAELDKNGRYIVYCYSEACPMADHLANEMRMAGFKNVWVYAGGVKEWRKNNMPATTNQ